MTKPHSLSSTKLKKPDVAQGILSARHGRFEKGTRLAETTVSHSPRRRVADFPAGFIKQSHIEHLEHNQMISGCCRHPENHDIEALKSHPDELCADIYIFFCTCGRQHRFFCIGQEDERPEWR